MNGLQGKTRLDSKLRHVCQRCVDKLHARFVWCVCVGWCFVGTWRSFHRARGIKWILQTVKVSITQGVSSGDPSCLAHTVSTVRFAALGLRSRDGWGLDMDSRGRCWDSKCSMARAVLSALPVTHGSGPALGEAAASLAFQDDGKLEKNASPPALLAMQGSTAESCRLCCILWFSYTVIKIEGNNLQVGKKKQQKIWEYNFFSSLNFKN